ncbi:MAG: mechanosensitive ion channel [Proteobacteria bacterium]|nr:mechanosensitive ion channel [Pseudomonadota bacterium]
MTSTQTHWDALTWDELLAALTHREAYVELGVALACLVLAWAAVRLMRGRVVPPHSIWFGKRIVDGVLFPALALVLTFAARHMLAAVGMPLVLFKIIIPVLLSFALIRLTVRVLTEAFPNARLVRMAERTFSWVAWLAVVGWITGVLPEVMAELDTIHWKMGGSTVSVRSLIEGALSAGFVLMLALWVSAAIENRLLAGAAGSQLSLRKAAANVVRATLVFVGLMFALSAVGIDLTALSVLGGALGVGLGFGLQKLAANYVSGFVILAERSMRIGDVVRVDGFEGTVQAINTRYTVVRSNTGIEALVPNETLITSTVQNLSLSDQRVMLSTTVGVAYGSNVPELQAALSSAIATVPRVLAEPAPVVHLANFGADGLELLIFFWIADPLNGQANVRSAVNVAILDLLNARGVEIPFPQRVVHLPQPPAKGAWAG